MVCIPLGVILSVAVHHSIVVQGDGSCDLSLLQSDLLHSELAVDVASHREAEYDAQPQHAIKEAIALVEQHGLLMRQQLSLSVDAKQPVSGLRNGAAKLESTEDMSALQAPLAGKVPASENKKTVEWQRLTDRSQDTVKSRGASLLEGSFIFKSEDEAEVTDAEGNVIVGSGATLQRAKSAKQFVKGVKGTAVCPGTTVLLYNEDVCKKASQTFGLTWDGEFTDLSRPRACSINENKVYWSNHATGAADPLTTPICVRPYMLGRDGASMCPNVTVKLQKREACTNAAKELNLTFVGDDADHMMPSGCYVTLQKHVKWSNNDTGNGSVGAMPLCARATQSKTAATLNGEVIILPSNWTDNTTDVPSNVTGPAVLPNANAEETKLQLFPRNENGRATNPVTVGHVKEADSTVVTKTSASNAAVTPAPVVATAQGTTAAAIATVTRTKAANTQSA